MRWFGWSIVLITFLLAVVGSIPARAAEEVTLPPLAPFTSARLDGTTVFNQQPLNVYHLDMESSNRNHAFVRFLTALKLPEIGFEQTPFAFEMVYYDGSVYMRLNDETTWTVSQDPNYKPTNSWNDSVLSDDCLTHKHVWTRIGRVDVNGVATTQYQCWTLDPQINTQGGKVPDGQNVSDKFLSDDNHIIKDMFANRGTYSVGPGPFMGVAVYRDIGAPIKVYTPPANLVRAAGLREQRLINALNHLYGR